MDDTYLIVLARAAHVLAGVLWAGFILVAAAAFTLAARGGPDDRRRLRALFGKLGPRMMPAALLLTLISGGYLMYALHGSDRSLGGHILIAGATAAILSAIAGGAIAGPAQFRLAAIDAAGGNPQETARLERRVTLGTGLAAAFILLSVLAMAVARYL